MKTNAQRAATIAFSQVSAIDRQKKSYCQKYGSMAHKLPIFIRRAGLAQALAFVQAKNEEAYRDLLTHVATAVSWPNITTGTQLAELSRSADLDTYILLTRRVIAVLIWYKRFAESVLGVKSIDDAPEGGQE
ncbi:MAG: type III-B CRISPR module-associated protein Cmr5 [Anaerolineales bacterium]|nr:type III-B CRISPR module-associated protein Cmr5 [Anaerolineales bacterium]